MAFTLKIQSKGLFNKTKAIDFGALLRECKLQHGSYNDCNLIQSCTYRQRHLL